jgi:hypothetical protein
MSTFEHIVLDQLVMARGSSLRIEDGSGITIRVRWGGAWLTQESDGRDHYLSPGESFRLDRGGSALVTALRRACVDAIAPKAEGYARRIVLWPAGGSNYIDLYPEPGRQLVTRLLSAVGLAHA